MRSNIQTFEVKVEVPLKGSTHYSYHIGAYIENKITKMFHKDAKNSRQAMQKCEKYGRPISAHKVDAEKMAGIGFLKMEAFVAGNPKNNAIAMDEMIWKRKGKRAGRLESRANHKE